MTKKQTIVLVDPDIIHSAVEGGLWGMRLLKPNETVVEVTYDDRTKKYSVVVEQTKEKDQSDLPW
jgi:hypothetical protein